MTEPIGLSTAWNGPGAGPRALLQQHRDLGFRRLEAYAHFTPDELFRLAEAAREQGMEIASLHAPCPVPVTERGERARYGDWLASTDPRERGDSVDLHKRSIDAAVEVGARAAVIHLGHTGVPSRQRTIFDVVARAGRGSEEHLRLRDEAWRERQAARGPHLEAALASIRALGEHALGTGVRLGVETRDGYQEIPSLDEVAEVLAACDGLPVGYWHDAGHGAKQAYAGFIDEHEEYLRRYAARLVGMHIHDTLGPRDHRAPGQGDTDFAMLARYLRDDTLRTLELHPSVTASEISWALELLQDLGAFGVREGILIEC
jgi:sugar phosphate isomerase/epimerase